MPIQQSTNIFRVLNPVYNFRGFYVCNVEKDARSRMNITFNLSNTDLEGDFLKGAKERNMVGLKGHRTIGGCRASLYNAVSVEDVKELVEFMKEFQKNQN